MVGEAFSTLASLEMFLNTEVEPACVEAVGNICDL